jgi:hypothetical protein
MKYILIAVITGILYAALGASALVFIVDTTIGVDLACRDCNGAAGIIVLILFWVIGVLFVFGFLVGGVSFFYFRNHATAYRKTALTCFSILFVVTAGVYGYFGFIKWSTTNNMEKEIALQKERDNYQTGVNVKGAEASTEFTKAIATNDSVTVARLIANGTPVKDIHLKYALDLNFNYNHPISISIFKSLFENGIQPNWKEYDFDPVEGSATAWGCQAELLSLLLKAGAAAKSEVGFYPTCAANLAVFVNYGIDINTKIRSTYYPYSTSTVPQSVRDNPNAVTDAKWTLLMKYTNNYPAYIDEMKFLIDHGADLNYQDENGESMKTMVDELIKNYDSSNDEIPEDLIELKKMLEKR